MLDKKSEAFFVRHFLSGFCQVRFGIFDKKVFIRFFMQSKVLYLFFFRSQIKNISLFQVLTFHTSKRNQTRCKKLMFRMYGLQIEDLFVPR